VLLSMTGFGDARAQSERLSVHVELRAVNNRYFKLVVKGPDAYAALESRVEKLIRGKVTRGTVNLHLRVTPTNGEAHYTLDRTVLESYWREISELSPQIGAGQVTDIVSLLTLPGSVIEKLPDTADYEQDWPLIRQAIEASLQKLHDFRLEEGRSMQAELEQNCLTIRKHLDQVSTMAPRVVNDFRDRLKERVEELLAQFDVRVDLSDLIREVSIFAERCDINEEITRLQCHLGQFSAFLTEGKSQGRKLDFLSQEMFREINTMGAKANDVSIAHSVVEMKAATERIREILQNVE